MQKEELEFLYQSVGNQIKLLRKKSQFSQEQLALKLNLSRVSIVNIEKGRQHPSIHLLIDVSRILNVPLSRFINDDMITEYTNKEKLINIKKKLNKASDNDIDQEKIFKFIQKTINKS